jgi:hypothetical protein
MTIIKSLITKVQKNLAHEADLHRIDHFYGKVVHEDNITALNDEVSRASDAKEKADALLDNSPRLTRIHNERTRDSLTYPKSQGQLNYDLEYIFSFPPATLAKFILDYPYALPALIATDELREKAISAVASDSKFNDEMRQAIIGLSKESIENAITLFPQSTSAPASSAFMRGDIVTWVNEFPDRLSVLMGNEAARSHIWNKRLEGLPDADRLSLLKIIENVSGVDGILFPDSSHPFEYKVVSRTPFMAQTQTPIQGYDKIKKQFDSRYLLVEGADIVAIVEGLGHNLYDKLISAPKGIGQNFSEKLNRARFSDIIELDRERIRKSLTDLIALYPTLEGVVWVEPHRPSNFLKVQKIDSRRLADPILPLEDLMVLATEQDLRTVLRSEQKKETTLGSRFTEGHYLGISKTYRSEVMASLEALIKTNPSLRNAIWNNVKDPRKHLSVAGVDARLLAWAELDYLKLIALAGNKNIQSVLEAEKARYHSARDKNPLGKRYELAQAAHITMHAPKTGPNLLTEKGKETLVTLLEDAHARKAYVNGIWDLQANSISSQKHALYALMNYERANDPRYILNLIGSLKKSDDKLAAYIEEILIKSYAPLQNRYAQEKLYDEAIKHLIAALSGVSQSLGNFPVEYMSKDNLKKEDKQKVKPISQKQSSTQVELLNRLAKGEIINEQYEEMLRKTGESTLDETREKEKATIDKNEYPTIKLFERLTTVLGMYTSYAPLIAADRLVKERYTVPVVGSGAISKRDIGSYLEILLKACSINMETDKVKLLSGLGLNDTAFLNVFGQLLRQVGYWQNHPDYLNALAEGRLNAGTKHMASAASLRYEVTPTKITFSGLRPAVVMKDGNHYQKMVVIAESSALSSTRGVEYDPQGNTKRVEHGEESLRKLTFSSGALPSPINPLEILAEHDEGYTIVGLDLTSETLGDDLSLQKLQVNFLPRMFRALVSPKEDTKLILEYVKIDPKKLNYDIAMSTIPDHYLYSHDGKPQTVMGSMPLEGMLLLSGPKLRLVELETNGDCYDFKILERVVAYTTNVAFTVVPKDEHYGPFNRLTRKKPDKLVASKMDNSKGRAYVVVTDYVSSMHQGGT